MLTEQISEGYENASEIVKTFGLQIFPRSKQISEKAYLEFYQSACFRLCRGCTESLHYYGSSEYQHLWTADPAEDQAGYVFLGGEEGLL